MNLDELQNFDLNDIASWPYWLKGLATFIIGAALVGAGYWFIIKGQLESLERKQKAEVQLKQSYKSKANLALNLEAYRQQMKEMQENFGVMLRQLPNKTEVPELLIDITQAGLGRSLKFVLFQPQAKKYKDFYAMLPINLKVTGSYHQIGDFVSDLAALPRIVTLGNLKLAAAKGGGNQLSMSVVVQTYHYLDESEARARAAKNKKKRKRK
jgi:type IV pilus assembly protein PilO